MGGRKAIAGGELYISIQPVHTNASKQPKTFKICRAILPTKDYPNLSQMARSDKNKKWLTKQVKRFAKLWHNGDIPRACRALENTLTKTKK